MPAERDEGKGGPLEPFHPLIREYFLERIGEPTEIQRLAWPRIAAGEHVLVSAPTGSGKTLTAFLWSLDRLFTGAWEAGRTRVLYVSPLRALNSDIRRNLEGPLADLAAAFRDAGEDAPTIRVATRSGDTPQSERRKMLRRPPEILVTTPESLNILLTSKGGRTLLDGLEAVILDEIHAVIGSKRGTHLITAVDRLVPMATDSLAAERGGEFQRIALSATVRPMETVAEFVGGFRMEGPGGDGEDGGEPRYRPREVTILRSLAEKRYDVDVRFPVADLEEEVIDGESGEGRAGRRDDPLWELLAEDFRSGIESHRSTLLFANSRRTTEKVTRQVNAAASKELAYSHHGSLSREVRTAVEKRLKEGRLRAIVATSSLELGIDVGDLDQVLLVQTPRSIASAVQRVGRAGHGVGETSRGVFYPTHGRDLLEAAVVAPAVVAQEIEEMQPVQAPLDVLAQVIVSMTVAKPWNVDALYHRLRASWPYRELPRAHYDLVLEMLAGRYAESRIRELRPRLIVDRVRGTVKARPGSDRLIYLSGGTIADRGYFALRLQDTMAKIGELDEEFVWERSVGDTFTLGAQSWRIQRITHNDVLVRPGRGAGSAMAPFWRADAQDRGFELCQRIAGFLESAEGRLGGERRRAELKQDLRKTHFFDRRAADELVAFLAEQHAATAGRLPRRDRVLVEECSREAGGGRQVIVHSWWGGAVHRPLAMALQAAWEERYAEEKQRSELEIFHDDSCLMLRFAAAGLENVGAEDVFALVVPDEVEELLRRSLARTGFFGSRFRWAAQTSLLLPKAGFRRRTPLWLSRKRSKRLLKGVRDYGDFPVVIETWRTCLRDEFDLENLKDRLARVRSGELPLERVHTTTPSPLAAPLVWQYTNRYMYEDDSPGGDAAGPGLRPDVLRDLVHSSELRPELPLRLVAELESKTQRLAPDYSPPPGDELALWLAERVVLPADEWRRLLEAVARDHGTTPADAAASVEDLAARVHLPAAEPAEPRETSPESPERSDPPEPPDPVECVVALDVLPRLAAALGRDVAAFAARSVLDARDPLGEVAAERLRRLGELAPAAGKGSHGSEEEAATGYEEARELRRLGVIAESLRAYGPVPVARLAAVWCLDEVALERVLDGLREVGAVVVDRLTEGARQREICDAENLERLLRMLRLDRRPSFEALDASYLPLFLALRLGVAERGEGIEGLQERLERLFGWPAPARLWEQEILPARLRPYFPAWLESAMQGSDLLWLGTGEKKLTFGFASDLEIFFDPGEGPWSEAETEEEDEDAVYPFLPLDELFPDDRRRAESEEILASESPGDGELTEGHPLSPDGVERMRRSARWRSLWRHAWAGRVTHDAYLPVRSGLGTRFTTPPPDAKAGRARRSRGRRSSRRSAGSRSSGWLSVGTATGSWRRLDAAPPDGSPQNLDVLEREELGKDRVRLLLQRWGVVFRQLLERELPALRWSKVFRSLRLMELSGEVLAGHFFRGVQGLQFVAHGAFRDLARGLPEDLVFWLNAADPASLCGFGVENLKDGLPARRSTTHVVYHGRQVVLVSRATGKDLELRVGVDHPRLTEYFGPLEHLLGREVEPRPSVPVHTVNGEPASSHPLARHLETVFRVTREGRVLRLWKRY